MRIREKLESMQEGFKLKVDYINDEKIELKKQLLTTDKVIMKTEMKHFFFRWHIHSLLKRILLKVGESDRVKSFS